MKTILQKTTVMALVAMSMIVTTASAQIIVDDSGGFAFAGSATSHTVTSANLGGFDANGSDKLVVSISGERAGASNNTVSGVTYGGVALSLAVASESTSVARKHSIWYLDNVSVTGDLVVSYVQSQSGIGLSAVALSNTVTGFADTATRGAITTTTSGEFVLAAGINNGGTISADSPLTQVFSGSDTGSSGGAAGYYIVPTAGSFTPSFTGDESFVAASFQAVPEPSSFALLGLGLGALYVLRRKK